MKFLYRKWILNLVVNNFTSKEEEQIEQWKKQAAKGLRGSERGGGREGQRG